MKRKVVGIALGLFFGLWAIYAIAANVILRTSLLRSWLTTDQLHVEYASAWSWLPGRVHARGYSMRFQDSNVQFQLDLERVTFQVDPFALVGKRFHLTHVDADGARFLFRHKLDRVEGKERRVAAYPHIEGFSDPPLKTSGHGPPTPDYAYRLWTIELDDVSTSLREIWVMEYRYVGPGSIAGGFRLKPERELRVDPSVMLTRGGVVSIGDQPVLARSHGALEAHVPNYDVRNPEGLEVFRQVDARVDLDGDVASLVPFGNTYIDAKDYAIERGEGRMQIHAHMDRGPLTEDSKVSLRSRDVVVKTPIGIVRGDALARASIERGKLVFDASLPSASLAIDGKPAVHARGAETHVDLGNDDVTKPFRLAGLSFAVASAAAPDLRLLAPLVPQLRGGAAEVAGRATVRGEAIDARADVWLDDAHVGTKDLDVVASGRAWASVASAAEARVANVIAGVEGRGVSVTMKSAQAKNLAVDVRTSGALLPRTDLDVEVRATPGDEVLRLVAGAASIPDAAADVVAGQVLEARARVRAARGDRTFDLLDAHDGKLAARGTLHASKARTQGAFLVSVGALRAGIEVNRGGASVTPAASDAWLEAKLR
ncbi:MAG TPA: hypothetical protein VIF62_19000 [Labilithrix sp.]